MAEFIEKIRTTDGDKQIDFEGLANKPPAVLYTEQTLTDEQKAQARANIGAGIEEDYALKTDLDDYAKTEDVPTQLAQLTSDSTHRVVTDAEKTAWNAKSDFSGNYNDLTNKPTIPTKTSDLTNDSGFLTSHQSLSAYRKSADQDTIDAAQNANINAKYSKPSGGIPKTDLASAVQTSLGKADSALQEHQDISGKQDKITASNKLPYSLLSGTPTIPTVPTNVSAFTNDSGYLTLATLPKYNGGVT